MVMFHSFLSTFTRGSLIICVYIYIYIYTIICIYLHLIHNCGCIHIYDHLMTACPCHQSFVSAEWLHGGSMVAATVKNIMCPTQKDHVVESRKTNDTQIFYLVDLKKKPPIIQQPSQSQSYNS